MNREERIEKVFQSFREINRTFFQLIRKESETQGITVIQMVVMRALYEKPNLGLSELAEKTYTGCSTLSGVVDRLVQADLVIRERLESDRRSITIRLTREGEEKYKLTFQRVNERLSALLSLADDELDQLLHIHGKISNCLNVSE